MEKIRRLFGGFFSARALPERNDRQEIIEAHVTVDKRALEQKIPEQRDDQRHREAGDSKAQVARDAPCGKEIAAEEKICKILRAVRIKQQRTDPDHEIFDHHIGHRAMAASESPLVVECAVDDTAGNSSGRRSVAATETEPCKHDKRRHEVGPRRRL